MEGGIRGPLLTLSSIHLLLQSERMPFAELAPLFQSCSHPRNNGRRSFERTGSDSYQCRVGHTGLASQGAHGSRRPVYGILKGKGEVRWVF